MFKKKLLAVLTAAVSLAAIGAAYAGGAFQGYPLVGGPANTNNPPGPSYTNNCLSFGNNGVCNQYQPNGPTSLTGNETIPADTNVQGAGNIGQPATVAIPVIVLGAGNLNYSVPIAAGTVTVACTDSAVVMEPAGTLATLTLAMPAASCLRDGQTLRVASTQTITALTVTPGSGTTIPNSPTALTVSTTAPYNYEFIYKQSTAKWYRVQ